LAPGDTLMAYTDGVVEAMNARREEWGQGNLENALCAGAAQGADAVISAVREGLMQFVRDVPQYDDMTMIVLRRRTAVE
ncbi:MAG: PP2C family protein-serine/threonine phosphatase, partial [Kiritimatiellia bacterium]